MHYSFDAFDSNNQVQRTEGSLNLIFRIPNNDINDNIIVNEINRTPLPSLSNDNIINNDNIYIKGGNGSMTIIDLFGDDADNNGVADQLEEIRDNEWLVNEANLKFYVKTDEVQGGNVEPERIFLYDITNNTTLLDYIADPTSNTTDLLNSRILHLGRLERDANDNGVSYTVRITDHIRRILNEETDNVRLALVVSQNVNVTTLSDVNGINDINGDEEVSSILTSSVIAHEGTVLCGPNYPDEDKRLKLNIFYTEAK